MRYALIFPGQGSQFVGMGADLFDHHPRLLEEHPESILGWSLRDLCERGPTERLTATQNAQPSLYAISWALCQELLALLPTCPQAAAGHSLGEYTALTAAGYLDYPTGLRLVAERGQSMAQAAAQASSGMAALIGAKAEVAEQLIQARTEAGGNLTIANYNAPGQVVVSGGQEDLEWLREHAPSFGVRRVVPLEVAGAFHSPFMSSSASRMTDALEKTLFDDPHFSVYSNVTSRPSHPADLPDLLVRQITAPVRFQQSVENMAGDGIDTFIHVGPGEVTAGLVRRTLPEVRVMVVSNRAEAQEVAETLSKIVETEGTE